MNPELKKLIKKLEIYSKGLIRYKKEYLSYETQYYKELEKIEALKSNNAETKQVEEACQETKEMLGVVKKKMIAHLDETKSIMNELEESIEEESKLNEIEEYTVATSNIKEIEEFIEEIHNKEY